MTAAPGRPSCCPNQLLDGHPAAMTTAPGWPSFCHACSSWMAILLS